MTLPRWDRGHTSDRRSGLDGAEPREASSATRAASPHARSQGSHTNACHATTRESAPALVATTPAVASSPQTVSAPIAGPMTIDTDWMNRRSAST